MLVRGRLLECNFSALRISQFGVQKGICSIVQVHSEADFYMVRYVKNSRKTNKNSLSSNIKCSCFHTKS